ncbi:DUF6118 family protein [Aurantiacibacter poecillastricola]|uniref:DUF6118 family protein n=1 Tax=Aurantiacibacter poecillastricola TaxID=3064385 RepID=UPI00273DC6DD|nr:DUF6118 family protein [Aurantiacibacter sp. 219JJ12-13]MDP5260608.1 DUF6118 family protein [Aurantiacibacter sp. 219JJ12-13]
MEDDHIEEVQLDLEVEEPPATPSELEPDAVEVPDPATEAFARLEGEMAMVRHTVQNMARERADIVIPDYTATLGQMADQLAQVSKTLTAIGNKPAIGLTPEDIAVQIKRASLEMLRDASDLFRHGRKDLDIATGQLAAIVGRVRAEDEQKRQIWRFAGVGVLAGILLWSILPGTITRAMPESWYWPERMAERALGESSRWNAGSRLMQSADPLAWHVLIAAADMQRDNRDKIEDCRKRANSSGKSVSCTLQIRAQNGDD